MCLDCKLDNLTGLYLDKDEYFRMCTAPESFVRENTESNLPVEILVSELQNALHLLTDEFLNGYILSKASKICYPFSKRCSTKSIDSKLSYILYLISLLDAKDKNTPEIKSLIKDLLVKKLHSDNIALAISRLYDLLEAYRLEFIPEPAASCVKVKASRNFDISNYKSKRLTPIANLSHYADEQIKQHARSFYLHGSLSTLDFCNYSDVDALCVVKKSTIKAPKLLCALQKKFIAIRRYFYQFDFLQHHGCFMITEYDLEYYPQTYFPLELFKYSTAIFQDDAGLNFRTRDCQVERINTLFRHVHFIRQSWLNRSFPKNLYSLKQYLSTLMLLPALYLQAKGNYCYKKYSFALCKKDFDPSAWTVINEATDIRDRWSFVPSMFHRVLLRCLWNPILVARIYNNLTSFRSHTFEKAINDSFYRRAFELSELMMKNIWEAI
jgi:hypothetical protein